MTSRTFAIKTTYFTHLVPDSSELYISSGENVSLDTVMRAVVCAIVICTKQHTGSTAEAQTATHDHRKLNGCYGVIVYGVKCLYRCY